MRNKIALILCASMAFGFSMTSFASWERARPGEEIYFGVTSKNSQTEAFEVDDEKSSYTLACQSEADSANVNLIVTVKNGRVSKTFGNGASISMSNLKPGVIDYTTEYSDGDWNDVIVYGFDLTFSTKDNGGASGACRLIG